MVNTMVSGSDFPLNQSIEKNILAEKQFHQIHRLNPVRQVAVGLMQLNRAPKRLGLGPKCLKGCLNEYKSGWWCNNHLEK